MEVSDPTTIYCDNLGSIQLVKNPVFHVWTKHIDVHYHFFRERVLSGEVELTYVPTDWQTADIFTKPLGLDKLQQFSGALGLRHLDVPILRPRKFLREVPKDHGREQERSGRDRDAESDDESDFGSADEAEGGSAEESENECEGRRQKKEPKPTKNGGDEAIKGEKTEDKLETANSDESENRSDVAESVRMFYLDIVNQPRAKRKRLTQTKRRQHRDNKGAVKDRVSRQAPTGRVEVRRVRRDRSGDPGEPGEPQVELEGEC